MKVVENETPTVTIIQQGEQTNEEVTIPSTVKMTVRVHQRGLSYEKEGQTMKCSESILKEIVVESNGKVPNYVGLANKFTAQLNEFLEHIKSNKGIPKKAGFFFETEIESVDESFNFKSITKLPITNLGELAKNFALFISGTSFTNIDYVQGTMLVGEGTEQVLTRILGNVEGKRLVVGARPAPIKAALKLHGRMQKEKDKILLSNVETTLLKNNPTLIPQYRAGYENKLNNAKIDLYNLEQKREGVEETENVITIGNFNKEVEKVAKNVKRFEAKLEAFNAVFAEEVVA